MATGGRPRRAPDDASAEVGFRGPQVCSVVGISYRQLDYWARTGLLRPSIADAQGSGTQRRYSYGDLVELKVIKRLLDAGLKLQQARQAVTCLRENLGGDLATARLVLAGNRSVLASSNGEVIDLLAGGQGVFNVLPLSGVVDELNAAIVELSPESLPASAGARADDGSADDGSADDDSADDDSAGDDPAAGRREAAQR